MESLGNSYDPRIPSQVTESPWGPEQFSAIAYATRTAVCKSKALLLRSFSDRGPQEGTAKFTGSASEGALVGAIFLDPCEVSSGPARSAPSARAVLSWGTVKAHSPTSRNSRVSEAFGRPHTHGFCQTNSSKLSFSLFAQTPKSTQRAGVQGKLRPASRPFTGFQMDVALRLPSPGMPLPVKLRPSTFLTLGLCDAILPATFWKGTGSKPPSPVYSASGFSGHSVNKSAPGSPPLTHGASHPGPCFRSCMFAVLSRLLPSKSRSAQQPILFHPAHVPGTTLTAPSAATKKLGRAPPPKAYTRVG